MKKIIAAADLYQTEDKKGSSKYIDEHYQQERYRIYADKVDAPKMQIEVGASDIMELQFEDGSSWICPADQVHEVFAQQRSASGEGFVLPTSLTYTTDQRDIKEVVLKIVTKFVTRKAKKYTHHLKFNIGKTLDEKIKAETGLFSLKEDGENDLILSRFKVDSVQKGPYLLFIHGFCSSVESAFSAIFEDEIKLLWSFMRSYYGENILGFDHHTVSQGPIDNVIELLEALPAEAQLDVMAHSRGGLLADILSKCDARNENIFTEEEMAYFDGTQRKRILELKALAKEKKIRVSKVIRAGSPVRGTYLLSKRLDHFLSAVLSGLGATLGIAGSPFYLPIKEFLLDIVQAKADTSIFPGIAAMVPNSPFQKMLNHHKNYVAGDLFVLEGDTDLGKNVFQSIKVILTNLFFRTGNDFVVNTNSMRFGILREQGAQVFRARDNVINHFRYFSHPESRKAIHAALFSPEMIDDYYLSCSAYELKEQDNKIHRAVTRALSYELGDYELPYKKKQYEEKPDLTDILFHLKEGKTVAKGPQIEVEILHGDLRFGDSLVMVGHLKEDGIVSAEKALNHALNFALEKEYLLGNYPSETNDSRVIYCPDRKPKGAIVIGLGDRLEFNEFHLRKAVYFGALKYANYMHKHCKKDTDDIAGTITSLCVGSGYGGLAMESALSSIIFGIQDANLKIDELNEFCEKNDFDRKKNKRRVKHITRIQFVEKYEHRAREAFYALHRIDELELNFDILAPEKIQLVYGRAKQLRSEDYKGWWHNLVVRKIKEKEGVEESLNAEIEYLSSAGRAKVDERRDFYSIKLVNKLLAEVSRNHQKYVDISNSLFQLLIPNDLKPIFRNQHNVLLKLDQSMANIPWEMIHDKESDKEPTFVNTGLIRQLISKRHDSPEKITRDKSILIIGDPEYTHYDSLPNAKAEAELVRDLFKKRDDWKEPIALINKGFVENSMALINEKYKILHIAGHGEYDPDKNAAGIVMEDTLIDSFFFRKLPNLPEMAFINCCYSGKVDEKFEILIQQRYDFAASIGVALIELGVRAVVITGWAVDDQPAHDFAEKVYQHMLDGESFGAAMQKARKFIYTRYQNSQTWGAYQCYGDPWYTIDSVRSSYEDLKEYYTEDEVLVDLYNLRNEIFKKYNKKWIMSELEGVLKRIQGSEFEKANIYEKVAEIYAELNELDLAIENYKKMQEMDEAIYTVRSLEKLNGILIKQSILKDSREGRNYLGDLGPKSEYDDLYKNVKNLERVIGSRERFYFLGSAAKHLAYARKSNIDTFMLSMRDNYLKAFEMVSAKSPIDYTYSLTMFLTAYYFTDDATANSRIAFAGHQEKIGKVLADTLKKIQSFPKKKKNFWHDIPDINIYTTQMLYSRDMDEISKLSQQIIDDYTRVAKSSGSQRNVQIEIENYEHIQFFVETLGPKSKMKSKLRVLQQKTNAFKRIHSALVKLKKEQ
jgi:hypothetical protein